MQLRQTVWWGVTLLLVTATVSFGYALQKPSALPVVTIGEFGEVLKQTNLTEEATSASVLPQTIYFVGDILLARHVEYLMKINGSDYPYRNVGFLAENTQAVVGNFEASVPKIHQKTPNFGFSFSVDPIHLPALKQAGFTHLSLANNHTFDKGADGFYHTEESLQAGGFSTFGHPTLLASTTAYTVLSLGTKKIALIALHTLHSKIDPVVLKEVVMAASNQSDLQFVYVHWGTEYEEVSDSAQRVLAQQLAELGVEVIIGHHPHVVQQIDRIANTLVFYSLGNFIFDQYFSSAVQQGLVLELSSTEDRLTFSLLPVTSLNSYAQPRLMNSFEKASFLRDLAKRSNEVLAPEIIQGSVDYHFLLASSSEMAIMD